MLSVPTIAFLLRCLHVATAAGGCDQGWVSYQSSCYKIVSQPKMPWPDAKKSCDAQHSHLVIIMTPEENRFVQNELRKLNITDPHMQFWTDGTDKDTEGTWIWDTTGESFEVTDWYPGEPNQHEHNEDCLAFYLSRYDYHWNDNHCDLSKGYICEKETITL